jgi:hypothetical protein
MAFRHSRQCIACSGAMVCGEQKYKLERDSSGQISHSYVSRCNPRAANRTCIPLCCHALLVACSVLQQTKGSASGHDPDNDIRYAQRNQHIKHRFQGTFMK